MQADELKKIEELAKTDSQVKELYEKHLELKKVIQKIEERPFHTPSEEVELKTLKKEKLEVKTNLLSLVESKMK